MKNVNENKIKNIRARFSFLTDQNDIKYNCILFNSINDGICIKTEIPLFKNDHLKIFIPYKKYTYTNEVIVSHKLYTFFSINFLSLSKKEQVNLDSLIKTILRKRI